MKESCLTIMFLRRMKGSAKGDDVVMDAEASLVGGPVECEDMDGWELGACMEGPHHNWLVAKALSDKLGWGGFEQRVGVQEIKS